MSMFSNVRDFHIAFGLLVSTVPGLPDDTALRSLRRNLLAEEVQEYFDAETDNDLVEIADALADIIYIICGTAATYGFEMNDRHYTVSKPAGLPYLSLRTEHKEHIRKLYTAYVKAEDANDLNLIRETLQYLMDSAAACASAYDIPLRTVFAEVHRSNMNKLVNGLVLRHPSGKVKKPDNWLPPNIKAILDATAS